MYCKLRALGINGILGYEVSVECHISSGLPAFEIVGLGDTAVKEARDRVRAAIKNSGFSFPTSRITLNLAPAGTKKTGTVYDLPILLGILAATGELKLPKTPSAFIGELSLEGGLRPVNGVLPMAVAAKAAGIENLYLPEENAREAALVTHLTVYPVRNVKELVDHFTGEQPIEPSGEWTPERTESPGLDFSEVKGQENVKRALEIAAAGGHNILLVGPPGSGKSMLAKRLPTILPALSRDEALEVTSIHSVMGLVSSKNPLLSSRPFRSPHHTVSAVGMAGGGSSLRPGEISLAHNGVLFLDEFPEFGREVLEVMRQPLEDGSVTITRVTGTVEYPSRFMLVCAMNPCKCGWYGYPRCTCSEKLVESYLSRLSGPMLDRIDIVVDVPPVQYDELSARPSGESSLAIKERTCRAREVQRARYDGSGTESNANMSPKQLSEFCGLDEASGKLMRDAFDRLGLTARSYDRILRVARTIADLAGERDISAMHLAEAIQFRKSAVI